VRCLSILQRFKKSMEGHGWRELVDQFVDSTRHLRQLIRDPFHSSDGHAPFPSFLALQIMNTAGEMNNLREEVVGAPGSANDGSSAI